MAYWAAVRVRPHRERLAEHCLKLLGFTVYSPRLRTHRIWHDRRQPIVVPLFPGNLFIEIVLQWRAAYQSPSVCSIIKNGHTPAIVPDAVIADMRRRERDGVIELRPLLAGARVRILSGPFRNRLGLCADMNGAQRVSVLLDLLGGEREVRLRADAVEPVDGVDSRPQRRRRRGASRAVVPADTSMSD